MNKQSFIALLPSKILSRTPVLECTLQFFRRSISKLFSSSNFLIYPITGQFRPLDNSDPPPPIQTPPDSDHPHSDPSGFRPLPIQTPPPHFDLKS